MCGHNLAAEQIWVLVQARPRLLAELESQTLRIGRWLDLSKTKTKQTQHSLIPPFLPSFPPSFIHSFIRSFIHAIHQTKTRASNVCYTDTVQGTEYVIRRSNNSCKLPGSFSWPSHLHAT